MSQEHDDHVIGDESFDQSVSKYLENMESAGAKFANSAVSQIDRWTLTLSGAGIGFSFAAIRTSEVGRKDAVLLSWVIVFLSASLVSALLTRGITYLSALHVRNEAKKAQTLNKVNDKYDAAMAIQYDKYFKSSLTTGIVSYLFLLAAILTVAASSTMLAYSMPYTNNEVTVNKNIEPQIEVKGSEMMGPKPTLPSKPSEQPKTERPNTSAESPKKD